MRHLAFGPHADALRHLGLSGAGFSTANHLGLERSGLPQHGRCLAISVAVAASGSLVPGLTSRGLLQHGPGAALYLVSSGAADRLTVSFSFATASPALDRCSRDEQENGVRAAFAGFGGEAPRLLEAMSEADDFYFSSTCQVRVYLVPPFLPARPPASERPVTIRRAHRAPYNVTGRSDAAQAPRALGSRVRARPAAAPPREGPGTQRPGCPCLTGPDCRLIRISGCRRNRFSTAGTSTAAAVGIAPTANRPGSEKASRSSYNQDSVRSSSRANPYLAAGDTCADLGRYVRTESGVSVGVGGMARPPVDRLPLSKYRVLPVAFVPAISENEEWFGAMCGCFGERDGFSEAFKWERVALGDAQHFISDETANLG